MNGKWTNGASGKEVFEWMLAAPRNYPFGTKIYFEWYGIGEVQDRGGAIVEAGNRWHSYDRIDIWMGYGDEGLQRAKIWWQRTIKGKIVIPSSENSLKFSQSELGDIGNLKVTPESLEPEVKKLQEIFTKADLYDGEIDGKYTSIEQELIAFQIDSWIVKDKEDWGAGYFWNKTIAALRKKYGIDSPLIEEPASNFSTFNHSFESKMYKIVLDYGELEINPDSEDDDIRMFQEFMIKIWEYNWSIDGQYSSIEQSLIDLQKRVGVIENRDDWWAGHFGSKTKTALWQYFGEQAQEQEIIEEPKEYSLSEKQIERLTWVIKTLKKSISSIAQRKGTTSQKITDTLRNQIEDILPSLKDINIREKLRYIGDNI